MIRFAVKTALASGAVYYSIEQGLWKDSNHTEKLYHDYCKAVAPYVKKISPEVPVQVPSFSFPGNISSLVAKYWNKGISATCLFIYNAPSYIADYGQRGISYLSSNIETQKLLNSLTTVDEKTESKK